MVARVSQLEQQMGINDLSQFTPRQFVSENEVADSHALMRARVPLLRCSPVEWEAGDMDSVERVLVATAATGFLAMVVSVILLLVA